MAPETVIAGDILPSPATDAAASQPLPELNSPMLGDIPAIGFAISHVAARYGLPMPWATIVAVAAGLGACQ
jgi:hypothetical protein